MNIKSLLLGSAAAMVVVSGAQAADAVVVEPEPVEYVRVCDAYGSGFFFIPGTETCIRISGFVRSAYEKYTIDGTSDGVAFDENFVLWGQRGRLNIDTRNETDWGTLRAVYRLEGGQANNDVDIDMDVALISLAGFRAGFAGANYWYYGFDDATIFDYTWAGDGFSVTIGAEDPRISYSLSNDLPGAAALGGAGLFGGGFLNNTNNGGNANKNVNFYAGFNYSGDGFGIAFTAAHDSIAVDQDTGDIGGWAYKVSANLDLSEFIPGGSIAGYYLWDDEYDTDYLHTGQTTFNPSEIWGVAFNASLSDEVQFWANYWDVTGTDISAGGLVGNGVATNFAPGHNGTNTGDLTQFGVGLNWFPAAAPGFSIKAAYYNGEIENAISPLGNTPNLVNNDADFDGFEVTVRRDF